MVWTCGHRPRKFFRTVEISGLWKIVYSYFGITLMNCEKKILNIKYLAYLQPMNQFIQILVKNLRNLLTKRVCGRITTFSMSVQKWISLLALAIFFFIFDFPIPESPFFQILPSLLYIFILLPQLLPHQLPCSTHYTNFPNLFRHLLFQNYSLTQ